MPTFCSRVPALLLPTHCPVSGGRASSSCDSDDSQPKLDPPARYPTCPVTCGCPLCCATLPCQRGRRSDRSRRVCACACVSVCLCMPFHCVRHSIFHDRRYCKALEWRFARDVRTRGLASAGACLERRRCKNCFFCSSAMHPIFLSAEDTVGAGTDFSSFNLLALSHTHMTIHTPTALCAYMCARKEFTPVRDILFTSLLL